MDNSRVIIRSLKEFMSLNDIKNLLGAEGDSLLNHVSKTIPKEAPRYLIETRAGRTIYDCKISEGAYLIFGCETTGIPEWFLNQNSADLARIPMWNARVRSLNLSNAVSIVLYEGIRQRLTESIGWTP